MTTKTPEEILREAEVLISQTERSLALTPRLLEAIGEGRESLVDAKLRSDADAEAKALFRRDMEEVEREVAEEMARLRFSDTDSKPAGSRRMRNLI